MAEGNNDDRSNSDVLRGIVENVTRKRNAELAELNALQANKGKSFEIIEPKPAEALSSANIEEYEKYHLSKLKIIINKISTSSDNEDLKNEMAKYNDEVNYGQLKNMAILLDEKYPNRSGDVAAFFDRLDEYNKVRSLVDLKNTFNKEDIISVQKAIHIAYGKNSTGDNIKRDVARDWLEQNANVPLVSEQIQAKSAMIIDTRSTIEAMLNYCNNWRSDTTKHTHTIQTRTLNASNKVEPTTPKQGGLEKQ